MTYKEIAHSYHNNDLINISNDLLEEAKALINGLIVDASEDIAMYGQSEMRLEHITFLEEIQSEIFIILTRRGNDPEKTHNEHVSFNNLPIENRYNFLVRYVQSLVNKISHSEYKQGELNQKIKRLEIKIAGMETPKEKIKTKVVRVQTPDAIGATLQLNKTIKSLEDEKVHRENHIRNLKDKCSKLSVENENLKTAIKMVRSR